MNWLYVALPLALAYVIWFTFIILKKKYYTNLLVVGLAHIPYLLVNLVAPFRGLFDPNYAGYTFGLIELPKGPWVTIVVGFIVISSLLIASRAILNEMRNLWLFAFVFDLMLCITMAIPVLFVIVIDPSQANIQLGEYLTISGVVVCLLIFVLFSGPTLYATYFEGRQVLSKYIKRKEDI